MAEFPMFPLWTDAYLADTTHLMALEHGAYLLLLITMWRTPEKSLPDDDALLARFARLTPKQWRRAKPVLAHFFRISEGRWTQGRLTDEAAIVFQRRKSAATNAKARWRKNKDTAHAGASNPHAFRNANPTHIEEGRYVPLANTESNRREPPNGEVGALRKNEAPTPLAPAGQLALISEGNGAHPPPATRGSRIPPGWQPPPKHWPMAQALGYTRERYEQETANFIDHFTAAAGRFGVKLDWTAAHRVWIRRDAPRGGKRQGPAPLVDRERFERIVETAERNLARKGDDR